MKVQIFQLGSFMTNSFLATSDDGAESVIIDAPDGIEQLIRHSDEAGITPSMLINTHGHVDHIAGNEAVKRHWPDIRLAIGADDAPALLDGAKNLSVMMGSPLVSPEADLILTEGDTVAVGNETFEVLHTPGHTPGGITLVTRPADGPPQAFVGDTLFLASVGNTAFPGGNMQTLIESIRQKLLTLPDETICYPGHGPTTTIGDERSGNPYL